MSTGKVVLGTMAGLAIGAIAGILFAPDKGSVTRKQISKKGDDYLDDAKSKVEEFFEMLSAKYEISQKEFEEVAEKGENKYDEVKKDVKNTSSAFKQSAT